MLIRINLLPPELHPRRSLIALDYRVLIGLGVVIIAIAMGGYYFSLRTQLAAAERDITAWKQQETILQPIVDLQNQVVDLRTQVAKRVSIIKELTGDSDVRFAMLQYINQITPDDLWLMRISEQNDQSRVLFDIEGMSYTKQSISAFLASLQKFEQFQSVSLESIRPAPLEIRDAYQFTVRVELKNSTPPASEAASTNTTKAPAAKTAAD